MSKPPADFFPQIWDDKDIWERSKQCDCNGNPYECPVWQAMCRSWCMSHKRQLSASTTTQPETKAESVVSSDEKTTVGDKVEPLDNFLYNNTYSRSGVRSVKKTQRSKRK